MVHLCSKFRCPKQLFKTCGVASEAATVVEEHDGHRRRPPVTQLVELQMKDQMVDFCFEDSLEKTDGFRMFSPRNLKHTQSIWATMVSVGARPAHSL